MPEPTSNLYRNANATVGGDLPGLLTQLRGDGHSYHQIAAILFADHGVMVSHQTLRNWAADLGTDEKNVA